MVTVNKIVLPDDLYEWIERRARESGVSVDRQVVLDVERLRRERAAEEELLAEIRAEREDMAKRGIFLTEESLKAAKEWGRP